MSTVNKNSYPDDDEYARIYIAAYESALPASTLSNPGQPRHWRLSAHASATVAVILAMAAASAPPVNPGAAV
jgi:hypothetical protein